jgi:hypothetical protein
LGGVADALLPELNNVKPRSAMSYSTLVDVPLRAYGSIGHLSS